MVDSIEESFPRGGVQKSGSEKKKKRVKRDENDLFKISSEIPHQKKAKKSESKKEKPKSVSGESEVVSAVEKITPNLVVDGMLLLGKIREIHDYKLVIALPENLSGEVSITDICAAYTNALKTVAAADIDSSEVNLLDELFSIGQLVCCKVKYVKSKDKRKEIHLTLDPKSINSNINMEKLHVNSVIVGNVASREDHGYTIDIGLPGLQGFVANADAVKFNSGKPLPVGLPVQCTFTKLGLEAVKSKSGRVVQVKLKNDSAKVIESMKDAVVQNILPGTVVNCEVVSSLPTGITVKFLGKFKGAIHRHQLNTDPSKLKKEQTIKACVLYHQPLAGISYLSMLPHLVDPKSETSKHHEKIQVGEIIESASVLHLEGSSGALLKLQDDIRGYLPLKYVDDNPKKRSFTNFVKTGIKCRVVGFDMMNNVAIVSCCKSYLDRSIVKLSDCKPGQVVEGKIQRFVKAHIVVLVAGFYRGFIPAMHNANVPLKNPEKKYKVDDTIKCRILKLEKSNRHALSLTAKESLVRSKLPILNSMEVLEKDMVVEGFIVKINPSGLIVAFYNDMRGFVHKSEAGEDLNILQENFYVGQVVKCRVISWDAQTEKIRLSMKLAGQENIGTKELKLQAKLDSRTTHACQISKITDKGLSVKIGNVSGFIPLHHLSDNYVNCKHLLRLFKPHQILDKVVIFERAATPIFTMKQSILSEIDEKPLPESLEELLPGTTIPGVVRNAVDFGIFIQLSHNLRGVAMNKFLADHAAVDVPKKFRQGQSVLVHIKGTDPEKNRISCSLRMSDCYQGDTAPAIEQVSSYLEERSKILSHYAQYGREAMKTLTSFSVGTVIDVEVDQINDFGSIGHEINSKVKVVCTVYHMEGCTVKVGEVRRAVVLYLDLESGCLEVTMSKKNVKAISHRVEGPSNKVEEGQVFDAQVLLVKREFVLIAVRGRAEHKLAYAPAQKCFNDITGSQFFEPGFSDKVYIKKVSDDFVVCSWQAFEDTGKFKIPKTVPAHLLEIGGKVRAVVREILPFQLNIRIGAIPGRIFASEIETEDFAPGDRLTEKFKIGEELSVVIIGFREHKSTKLSKHMGDRAHGIPECSTLTRRLEGQVDEKPFEYGQKIPGFYYHTQKNELRFRLSPSMNGNCQFLNANLSIDELKKPEHLEIGAYYPLTFLAHGKDGGKTCEVSMVGENDVKNGAKVIAQVWRLRKDNLLVKLPWKHKGTVPQTEMRDEYVDNIKKTFKEGQYVRALILDDSTEKMVVTLRASRVISAAKIPDPRNKSIESEQELVEHEIVRGFVSKCAQNSVTVQLGKGVFGTAHKGYISDRVLNRVRAAYPKGKVVTVKILKVQGSDISISLRESDTGVPEPVPENLRVERKRRNSDRVSECDREEPARKRRTSESESESGRRRTDSESSVGPRKRTESESSVGSRKRTDSESSMCSRKRTESGSEFESPALGTRKRRLSEMSDTKEEEEDEEMDIESLPRLDLEAAVDSSSDEEELAKPKPEIVEPKAKKPKKEKKKTKKNKAVTQEKKGNPVEERPCLEVDDSFAWVTDFQLPSTRKTESESSDDETETPVVVKENKKLAEKRLMELENRLLDSNRKPETEDEFDRLVVQSPDSSVMWMQYMAHHLKMAEIDKARTIAERALKTISFREEQEKMNIWAALMNLENTYGTPEQLKAVFDRAVQMNDSFKIHSQLVSIYENSDKVEQAERLHSTIVRQFSLRKQVWIDFCTFYFKYKRYDSARKVLERSLKTLDKRDHMEVVTKFGRLEFEHGQTEQATQLFERVLAECPKRLDAWNVYIDLLVKYSTPDKVRRIFSKLMGIEFPAKKMKSVFKKWLDFEMKHGDEALVSEVKERAAKYARENTGK